MGVLWLYLLSTFVSLYKTRLSTEYRMLHQKSVFPIRIQNCSAGKMTEKVSVLENAYGGLIFFPSSLGQQWPFVTQKDILYSKTEITDVHVHHKETLTQGVPFTPGKVEGAVDERIVMPCMAAFRNLILTPLCFSLRVWL